MRNSLSILLLLIFALLFAQLGGLVHNLSHVLEHAQSGDQSAPQEKHCDLCDAYAHITSAISSSNASFDGSDNPEMLHFNHSGSSVFNTFAAFTARAPPYSA